MYINAVPTPYEENQGDLCKVRVTVNYLVKKINLNALVERIVRTDPIDSFFNYLLGALEYRSIRLETEVLEYVQFPRKYCDRLHRL